MSGSDTYVEPLGRTPFFSRLRGEALRHIAGIATEFTHPDGKAVVVEGHAAHAMHVIVEGEAVVTVGGATVGRLGPGDSFGEVALFDKGPRTATVTAKGPLHVIAIDGITLHGLVMEDGEVGLRMLAHLAWALRSSNGALAEWQLQAGDRSD